MNLECPRCKAEAHPDDLRRSEYGFAMTWPCGSAFYKEPTILGDGWSSVTGFRESRKCLLNQLKQTKDELFKLKRTCWFLDIEQPLVDITTDTEGWRESVQAPYTIIKLTTPLSGLEYLTLVPRGEALKRAIVRLDQLNIIEDTPLLDELRAEVFGEQNDNDKEGELIPDYLQDEMKAMLKECKEKGYVKYSEWQKRWKEI